MVHAVKLDMLPAAKQLSLAADPYDRWLDPDGDVIAEFRRAPQGYCLRFVGQADFLIAPESGVVQAIPADNTDPATAERLFANAVTPLLDNHAGRLALHGSAVAVRDRAVAFVGTSRRGKTTLAGAFAKAGHPFIAEDALRIDSDAKGYCVLPSRPVLRLAGDSVSWLTARGEDGEAKRDIPAGDGLPHCDRALRLAQIFILGDRDVDGTELAPLKPATALAALLPHAFILDCEDKSRLRDHFARMSALAAQVPCSALDYPREFALLPQMVERIAGEVAR